jgi:DNA-binding transcriptional ArsR family regulator
MDIPCELDEWLKESGGMEGIKEMLPKDEALERKSRIYGALSDPIRLKILHLLAIHPLCVCLIKEVIDMADSKLSYHLSVLKGAGMIEGERRGKWILYRITEEGRKCLD